MGKKWEKSGVFGAFFVPPKTLTYLISITYPTAACGKHGKQ
jgi:hypothetical protein